METLELKAYPRTNTGNGPARQLRSKGQIPAIVYGPGKTNQMVSVNNADIQTLMRRGGLGRTILSLNIDGAKKNVQVKELQTNHLTREVLHIDFYEVSRDTMLTVTVPVIPVGTAVGVENGGVLQLVLREITFICPATKIPDSIEVDVTKLEIGDVIRIGDITFPEDVVAQEDERFAVITIVDDKAAAGAETEDAEAAEGEAAEPEAGEDAEA